MQSYSKQHYKLMDSYSKQLQKYVLSFYFTNQMHNVNHT